MINKNAASKNLPTIKDVAVAAGVSLKTVSRVINDEGHVREQTREKVLAAIKAIGYQPNAIARSLRVRKTYTIGVIIADVTNSFFSMIVRGIEDVAAKKNYSVIIANSDESLEKERAYVRVFAEKQVEGMIIVPASGSQKYLEGMVGHIPLIFVDRCPGEIKGPVVKVENEKGSYELTSHLLRHGYEEIAFIGCQPNLTTAIERFAGFKKALNEYGLKIKPHLVKTGNKTMQDAYRAIGEMFKQPRRPQAILATNNFMLIGALRALNHMGMEVPRDVALVGFDDFEMADVCRPYLTVVTQPAYAMGREAASALFKRMNNPEIEDEEIVLPVELVTRESCGCINHSAKIALQA